MSCKIIRANDLESSNINIFSFETALPEPPPVFPKEPVTENSRISFTRVEDSVDSDCASLAEQQAEVILRQARLKVDEIEKEAYEKGFSEGEKAGREVGEKMVEALLKQYATTLEELKALRRETLLASEREVIRLSLEVAKKVVRREVHLDEELILTLVKVALSRLAEQSAMTVRVNPKDYQSILHFRHTPDHRDSLHEGIKLTEDPLIARGGCLIETESGVIDARVEEQFREIEKGFFE